MLKGETSNIRRLVLGGVFAVIRSTSGGNVLAATHKMYPIFGRKP